jgi:hypothetical protein
MSKQRTSGRRKREPRGVHLSVHNKRDLPDDPMEEILREERRQAALAEVRREQERLERRIAREKVEPVMGATAGAEYVAAEPEPAPEPVRAPMDTPALALRFPELPWEGDGNESRAIRQARAMLRQGYNIRKVVTQFGIGLKWLDDIPIDETGFGLPEC